jgi:transposase
MQSSFTGRTNGFDGIAPSLSWPARMHELLMDYYRASDYGKGVAKTGSLKQLNRSYAELLKLADEEEPPPTKDKKGKPKKSKVRNLMERLKNHQETVLVFSRHTEVPFTNNLGERGSSTL